MVDPPIDFNHCSGIFAEQMETLEQSGLLNACSELYLGASGGEPDVMAVSTMAPKKAHVIAHDLASCGELPTLCALQKWLPGHSDWGICYFHTKGATNPGLRSWRKCMENVVLWNWQQCVKDLEAGYDCAGPHWVTPGDYPGLVGEPYFAGTFWWAKGSYLITLPTVDPNGPSRWEAEVWIGRSDRKIRVRRYADHWPTPAKCSAACGSKDAMKITSGSGRRAVRA